MEPTYVGFPDDFDNDSDEEDPDNRFFTNKIMKPNHDVFTKCLHYFMDSLKKKEKKIIEYKFMEDPRWKDLNKHQKQYLYDQYEDQYNYYQEHGYDF